MANYEYNMANKAAYVQIRQSMVKYDLVWIIMVQDDLADCSQELPSISKYGQAMSSMIKNGPQ